MTIEEKKIIQAWNIRLDRVPQLRKIASDNNLDIAALVTYEALSYVMAQWRSAMSWPITKLTDEVVRLNEVSRPYLMIHAQLFLNAPELPIQVAESIEPVIELTRAAWSDAERVRLARKNLDIIIDTAETRFTHDPLFNTVLEYSDSHEKIVTPAWNKFVKSKYHLEN